MTILGEAHHKGASSNQPNTLNDPSPSRLAPLDIATTPVSDIPAQTALTIHEGRHSMYLYLIKVPSLLPSEFLLQRPEFQCTLPPHRVWSLDNLTTLGCNMMDVQHMLCMDLGRVCPHKCMNTFEFVWDPGERVLRACIQTCSIIFYHLYELQIT